MNPQVNEELIDNLVCGTLQGPEYRKAILALEADPKKWRECALAFLQEQALSQELVNLSQSNIDWQQGPSTPTALSVVSNQQTATQSLNQPKRDELGWLYKLGTLAALLLLSFSVGWIGSSIRDRSALANPTDMPDGSELARKGTTPELTLDQIQVDQVLPSDQFGSNNYSLVGNSNVSLLPIDEKIPPSLAKLEREGRIRIEKATAIMPVECESGTMLVPVQQFRVVPVMFSY
jgi:hypothetical protein